MPADDSIYCGHRIPVAGCDGCVPPETTIPDPVCDYGYTETQLDEILGEWRSAFSQWMCGQTMAICDGRRYNHDTGSYEATGCGPHGVVVYPYDLRRFLSTSGWWLSHRQPTKDNHSA